MHITTCNKCGTLYEEQSEELANRPGRLCGRCLLAGYRADAFGNVYLAPPPCDNCNGTGKVYKAHLDGAGQYRTVGPCPECA